MSKITRKTRTAQIDLNSPSPPKGQLKIGEFDLSTDALQVKKSPNRLSPNKRTKQRVSILTDISFSHPKTQVETQIVNKVEHIFFWGDGRNQSDQKVDITGNFNNWKRQKMNPIKDIQNINATIPKDATHFIKKSLDPKKYNFYFVVNNIDKISVQYEKNIGQNTNYVDLKHEQTQMLIKKKERPLTLLKGTNLEEIVEIESPTSNYLTIEDYVKNEEINLDEEHEKDIKVVQEIEESLRGDESNESPTLVDDNADADERVVQVSDCDESLDIVTPEVKKFEVKKQLRLKISLTETFKGYQEGEEQLTNQDMFKDDFKIELNRFSSLPPLQNRGQHTSRNPSLSIKNLNFFNKFVPRSRKNSDAMKKKQFFNTQESEKSETPDDQLNMPSSGSECELIKLNNEYEEQDEEVNLALEIYDNIFSDSFDDYRCQVENGEKYITIDQYSKALNELAEEDSEFNVETQDQINHFLDLIKKIEQNETGKVFKKFLINALKEDILRCQEGESPCEVEEIQVQDVESDEMVNLAEDLVRTKSSFIRPRQLSQDDNGTNWIEEEQNLQEPSRPCSQKYGEGEEDIYASPNKNINDVRRRSTDKQQVTAMKNGKEYNSNVQKLTFNSDINPSMDQNSSGSDSSQSDFELIGNNQDSKCQTSARKRKSKLYNNFMNEFMNHNNEINDKGEQRLLGNSPSKVDMKDIKDTTLNSLNQLAQQDELSGLERSENLISSTDYILQNKLKEFTQDPKLLECFLKLFKENQKKILTKIEDQNRVLDHIKEHGSLELQQFHQENLELENENEILRSENEILKRYELSYHPMEERMKIEQDKNDQLLIDKEEIEQIHSDLITEFNQLKQQNEQYQMDLRTSKKEVDGLVKQNASLRQNIIGGQIQRNDSSEEEDQDMCQEHEQINQDLEQDIPQPIEETVRKEDFSSYKLTPQQLAINKITEEQENEILLELSIQDTYILSKRISDYIINYVQIAREGQENLISKQYKKLVKYENKMRKKLITMKFRNDKLFHELENTRFQQTQFRNLYQEKKREIDELQQKIQDLVNEINEIKDDKNRIIGVNQILEKRMQVEKSEMNTLQGDLQSLIEISMGEQNPQQLQKQNTGGQFSSYTRNIKNAIRSNKGSVTSGVQRRGTIEEGYNQNMYLKNQNRHFGGNQSSFHDNGSMYSGIQPSATGTNYGNGGMIFDNASNFSRSVYSKKVIQKIGNASIRGSMRGSITGSMKGSVFSGKGRDGERVQKINAFSSNGSDESMVNITGDELKAMNQEIQNEQQDLLTLKRQQNVYDLVGLADPDHFNYKKVEVILEKHFIEKTNESGLKDRSTKFVSLKDAKEKSFYSEIIKVYINRSLKDVVLLIYQGIIYFIQLNETNKPASLLVQPVSLLDDINRVIFSETYDKYLAFKLRDMRKTQGSRDHIVFELKDRELFADFVMEYAEAEEDEILFEANEEFSMIVNSSPVWFSFGDVERLKKQDNQRQLKQKDMTGFLEMKQTNVLKVLFSKNAGWENRYFALQGTKLFIYKGHEYNKPLQIIEITEDMKVQELSKKDSGGKLNVFQVIPGQNKQKIVLAASTQKTMENWIKSFKNIKDMFDLEKQKIIDKLKEEVVKKTGKKERVSVLFTQGGNLNLPQLPRRDSVINEVSEAEEGESCRIDNTSRKMDTERNTNRQEIVSPTIFNFDDLYTMESGMRKQTIRQKEGESIKNSMVDINLIKKQMEMQHKRKQTQLINTNKVLKVQKIVDKDSNDDFQSCDGSDFTQ